MNMNNQTKLLFIAEHILHIEDLIQSNSDECILQSYLNDVKSIVKRQYAVYEQSRDNLPGLGLD